MTVFFPTIVITGATAGLGRALAVDLSQQPYHLILHGRSREKLAAVADELAAAPARVSTVRADMAQLDQVRGLAEDIGELTDEVSVLVNNAGIGPGAGDVRQLSADGHELRLAVNHLAPFLLSLQLLPLLRAGAPARIVHVASGAQTEVDLDDLQLQEKYSGSRAYAQSKLAMITTSLMLAEKLPARQVTVNSLHPASLMPTALVAEGYGMTIDSLEQGVAATRRLIDAPELADVTGRYFSGTQESRPLDQAFEAGFRTQLWQETARLTGAVL